METGTQGDTWQTPSLWQKSPRARGDLEPVAEAAFGTAAHIAPVVLEQRMGLTLLAGFAITAISPFCCIPLEKGKENRSLTKKSAQPGV